MLKLVECPRDAMQGLTEFIPTQIKIDYINHLLTVGFDTIDFGSFVSHRAIPQMKDTASVLAGLNLEKTSTKLLAIVPNQRGARDACKFEEIHYLGYPFSISETFQKRNANATIDQSLKRVEKIHNLCVKHNKEMLVYISMAFGNPYEDPWGVDIAAYWSRRLHNELGIKTLALSDTIGVSNHYNITELFEGLINELPNVEFGAHLHSTPDSVEEKVNAAYQAGCRRFDGAIRGFGGCPMAKDDLTGNMPTEQMKLYFDNHKIGTHLDEEAFSEAMNMALTVFPH